MKKQQYTPKNYKRAYPLVATACMCAGMGIAMLPACNPNNEPQPLITDTTKITDSIIDTVRDTVDTIIQEKEISPVQKVLIEHYKALGVYPVSSLKAYSLAPGEIKSIRYYDETGNDSLISTLNEELSTEDEMVYDNKDTDLSLEQTSYTRDTIRQLDDGRDGVVITRYRTKPAGVPPSEATGWKYLSTIEKIKNDKGEIEAWNITDPANPVLTATDVSTGSADSFIRYIDGGIHVCTDVKITTK